MPNIRTFQAPNLGLRPSEVGVDAAALAARRVGTFYSQQAGAVETAAGAVGEEARNLSRLGSETEQLGNEKAQEFNALGRVAGSSIEDAGDVALKYMDHQQISHGATVASDMLVDLENQWNNTVKTADPNDPSVRAKFMEEVVKPRLEKFQNGDENGQTFTTENSQKFAEGIVAKYYDHFNTKTAADMATMAGIAARENAQKTVNSLSSAAYNDPSTLQTALDTLDHSTGHIVGSSPTLDAATGARVKSEIDLAGKKSIVKSAIMGAIAKNPNVDLSGYQRKYGDLIDGAEMGMFQKAAQAQAKSNALVDKQTALLNRQLSEQAVRSGATKIMSDNITFDENGEPVINPKFFSQALELARRNPDAPNAAETVRTMFSWGQSQQNKEAKAIDDPAVKRDLTDRLFSADNPTTRIDLMRANAQGKLSNASFQSMERLVTELETSPLKGPVWQSTAAAAKDALIVNVPGLPGKDTKGIENYSSFMQSFVPQYLAKSRAGTLPPNALDLKDPNSMISQALAPFKRTQAERMRDYINGARGEPEAPRNDVMPAIPPPNQRPPNSIYETPRGKMKWTGTGWVQP